MNTLLAIGVVGGIGALVLSMTALTTTGARRRGQGWARALLSGVAFPVTWLVWYAVDELPGRRPA